MIDALQTLVESKTVPSTSAAVTEALTGWIHNRLLRFTLDEIYREDPELRPTAEEIAAMARRVGIVLGTDGDAAA